MTGNVIQCPGGRGREHLGLGKDGRMDEVFVNVFPCLPPQTLSLFAIHSGLEADDDADHRANLLFFREYVAPVSQTRGWGHI